MINEICWSSQLLEIFIIKKCIEFGLIFLVQQNKIVS